MKDIMTWKKNEGILGKYYVSQNTYKGYGKLWLVIL